MEHIYFKLVPNIYIPEPIVMGELLKHIKENGMIEYLQRLWSDMKIFEQTYREELIKSILEIMIIHKSKTNELQKIFSTTAWDIYHLVCDQEEHRTRRLQ